MLKKVLVINSSRELLSPLFGMFGMLRGEFCFVLLNSWFGGSLKSLFIKHRLKVVGYPGWFLVEGLAVNLFLLVMYPLLVLFYSFFGIFLKVKNKFRVVVMVGFVDKVFFSLIFKVMRCRVVWIELPNDQTIYKSKIARFIYFLNKRFVDEVVVFSSFTRDRLVVAGVKKDRMRLLSCGFDVNKFQHQDDLFNNIVEVNRRAGRRYFTVGVIAELVETENIKILFQAIAKCVEVIPNIQLVVIGDGPDKKSLSWLTKTMKLENLVWFVGRQMNLGKWIDNLDCFVVTSVLPSLVDFSTVYSVMYGGKVIIAQRHVGLDDVVVCLENRLSTLVDIGNHEVLAKKIVEVEQRSVAGNKIGELQKVRVLDRFMFDDQVAKLKQILLGE